VLYLFRVGVDPRNDALSDVGIGLFCKVAAEGGRDIGGGGGDAGVTIGTGGGAKVAVAGGSGGIPDNCLGFAKFKISIISRARHLVRHEKKDASKINPLRDVDTYDFVYDSVYDLMPKVFHDAIFD
jgi:hypothetical protein